MRYFSDWNGETVLLKGITTMLNTEFMQRFPGVKGIRSDGYSKYVGWADNDSGLHQWLPVTRRIDYKSYPSRHECNAKCLNGKFNGACECRCGGKNHGRGAFTRLLADDAHVSL
ncbi:hypothetical protein ACN8ZM_39800 (plasmid) [Burkholderia aenigmatica]|uniref:hypothetical protein n=1 Tax=Burkholderia aenigmatica TaxID=2015348 RepID=UPI003B43CBBD